MIAFIRVHILRLFAPGNRLLTLSMLLSVTNTVILLLNTGSNREICPIKPRTLNPSSVHNPDGNKNESFKLMFDRSDKHWTIEQNKNKYKITFDGDFNWEFEFSRMMSIVPILHHNYTRGESVHYNESKFLAWDDTAAQWDKARITGKIMTQLPQLLDSGKIFDALKSANIKLKKLTKAEDDESGKSDHIWNCKELGDVEKTSKYPKLKYVSRSISLWRGSLVYPDQTSVQIMQKRWVNTESQNLFVGGNEGENGAFEAGKRDLLGVLSAQGWYGVPRVHGVCIMDKQYEDMYEKWLKGEKLEEKLYLIRYVITNYNEENSLPFCPLDDSHDDCLNMKKISYRIRSQARPAVAALQIMLNTAKMFENMIQNRAYLDGITANEIVLTKDLNVYITGFHSFIVLPYDEYNLGASYTRPLSGTICKHWRDCPAPTWYTTRLGASLASSCAEVKGMCSTEGLCWGVDMNSYTCMFSRWLFSRVLYLIPSSWEHRNNLTDLVQCGATIVPERRCTWWEMRKGFQGLLDFARQKWPPLDETKT